MARLYVIASCLIFGTVGDTHRTDVVDGTQNESAVAKRQRFEEWRCSDYHIGTRLCLLQTRWASPSVFVEPKGAKADSTFSNSESCVLRYPRVGKAYSVLMSAIHDHIDSVRRYAMQIDEIYSLDAE